MAIKKDLSLAKQGMQKDKHPSQLQQQEYVSAKNANLSNESGNFVNISNEHSNILSSKFLDGYKVVGFKNDINSSNTYFFLTNPTTNISEFGYITNIQNVQNLPDIEVECPTCDYENILAEPLENTVQTESQVYVTLLSDCSGNKCFNLSVLHPIKKIEIKTEKDFKSIYFTDNYNPPRYIQLNDLDIYSYEGVEVCGDESGIEDTCLACDKMRIFKQFDIPILQPESVVLGGRLLPGDYEFLIAYSDILGNEISEYYSITNPVTIFDENNIISDGMERTNFAIKLDVLGLDRNFGYYKIVVIQTNSHQETTYYVEGVHPINDNSVLYTTEQNKKSIDFDTVTKSNIHVERWEGLTQANGYLFGYGLTVQKEINLQPIVSLMGSFLRWQTHIAKENLYKDGVANSKFKSYHRDEVYPFSIRFTLDGGYTTANLPFIGRPALGNERDVLPSNQDVSSIQYINDSCVDTGITERWQLYNTAEALGVCQAGFDVPTTTVTEEVTKTCYIPAVATAPSNQFSLTLDQAEQYTNLYDFIALNKDNCAGYPFCSYLNPASYSETCTPDFDNCTSPTLQSQDILVGSVEGEVVERVEKSFASEYSSMKPPIGCSIYTPDTSVSSTGDYLRDTNFEKRYMPFVYDSVSKTFTFNKVYKRNYNFNNETCNNSETLVNINNTDINLSSYFNNYLGADTQAGLQTDKNSSVTSGGFYNKVSKSALWFKGNTLGRDTFIIEVSKQLDPIGDDDIAMAQNVRLDIFNNCTATSSIYGDVINLSVGIKYYVTVISTGLLIKNSVTGTVTTISTVLTAGDFFLSIDIPMKSETVLLDPDANPLVNTTTTRWHTAPTDGCFSIATRNVEYKQINVSYDSIIFDKKMVFSSTCSFEVPQVQGCDALPYQYGKFAYVESTEIYPDNAELYDSSGLVIEEDDIPVEYQDEFRDYFANSVVDGVYTLKSSTNFACQPIRHFKFPDNKVSPFMWETKQAPFVDSIIYPIGVTIDENLVNKFLDVAVKNELITQEVRDKIVGYEILRGDRTLDKGIVAKGLMYDMLRYKEKASSNDSDYIYYSNYPYNDLGSDKLNLLPGRDNAIPHPFDGEENYNFTFHSPETDYNKLTLPNMVKVEGYMFGQSRGFFNDVKNHPKWVILGSKAKKLATTLAILEVASEIAIEAAQAASNAQVWFQAGYPFVGTSLGIPAYVASGLILTLGLAEGITSKAGRYRYQWLQTFRDLGTPRNFASYYASEGHYNYLRPIQVEGNLVRNLQIAKNIKPALRLIVTNEVEGSRLQVNNADRESSVLISTGKDFPFVYPSEYMNYDNGDIDFNTSSRTYESLSDACASGKSDELRKNIASMYVSLKNYSPTQYGTLGSVKWLTTGYRGDLKNPKQSCLPIFGGDVFISRHTLKRKIPMFVTTEMGQADLTPYEYKFYSNIGKEPKFYVNYEIDNDGGDVSGTLFPDFDSEYQVDCPTGINGFYIKNPSKFYLYYYGIPNFLVETEINTNYRRAKAEPWDNFYPNVGDFMDWTQESVVSIKRDNKFYYDQVFSKNVTPVASRLLPVNYSRESFDRRYDSPNGVMYSLADNSENDSYDPWLIYRPLDFYQFPTAYGKLKELRGIETGQVLGRFENQAVIFNAVDVLVDGITSEQKNLGSGGIFARRPVTFSQTDLGYAGSQSTEMVSCEFGHFYVDAKRGQVFFAQPGGKGIEEISSTIDGKPSGMSNWFKEQLPFKILKTVPNADVDNAYNGIGIVMGWDSRYKRIFITKKDYITLVEGITYSEGVWKAIDDTEINLEDEQYFKEVSWTIAYSPVYHSWISYYDFYPNYYISHNNYFQTGINAMGTKFGLWSHLLTNKSYQVFYGTKYSFDIEYPIKSDAVTKTLNNIELWTEAKRNHREFDYAVSPEITFNKATVYNSVVNSGNLNLVPQKNNLAFTRLYPKTNNNNTQDILISNVDNFKWSFDYIFNRVKNSTVNQPNWIWDKNQIDKIINPHAVVFGGKRVLQHLYGDYFINRLRYDKDSRYNLVFKWGVAETQV